MSVVVTTEQVRNLTSKGVDVLLSMTQLPEEMEKTETNKLVGVLVAGGAIQFPHPDYDGINNLERVEWSEVAFFRNMYRARLDLLDSVVFAEIREGDTEKSPSDPEIQKFIISKLVGTYIAYLALEASSILYDADYKIKTKQELVDKLVSNFETAIDNIGHVIPIDSDELDEELVEHHGLKEVTYEIDLEMPGEKFTLMTLKSLLIRLEDLSNFDYLYAIFALICFIAGDSTDVVDEILDNILDFTNKAAINEDELSEKIDNMQNDLETTLSEKDSALNFISVMLLNAAVSNGIDITAEDLDKLKEKVLKDIEIMKSTDANEPKDAQEQK